LWFAGNAVIKDLTISYDLDQFAVGHLTSAVQFGFISGTFLFALLSIADRFRATWVFFICAILGAIFNLGLIWEDNTYVNLIIFRYFTGFFLAGIYPVGMKIASDHFDKGLGRSLGFLVGALVLGTAFPHLLNATANNFSWKMVISSISGLALIGGLLLFLFVPEGPLSSKHQGFKFSAFLKVFKVKAFRSAALGYFGHMWELYAFWAFVPLMISAYNIMFPASSINVSVWSFIIISVGGLSCILGGYLSEYLGTKKVASFALGLSGLCCLISPIIFQLNVPTVFLAFMVIWGMAVIADSPLFSSLIAKNAPIQFKGTALTIVNCIGFTITILSIELLTYISGLTAGVYVYSILAVGPILGLYKLWR
jgi:MFS family permease